MSGFLTDGRLALIERLQANHVLEGEITTWIRFGSGLQQRLAIEPAQCPLCSIAPNEYTFDQNANVLANYPQRLQVDLGVAGQDCEPLETLLCEGVYRVIQEACQDSMGLARAGLKGVWCDGTQWFANPDKEAARFVWVATTIVRLEWSRTQPHED